MLCAVSQGIHVLVLMLVSHTFLIKGFSEAILFLV